mgnify:CR=1 FL=1
MDIVGFTEISNKVGHMKIVDMLNEFFSQVDELLDSFHVEKIKTIGDAYMVASGVPERFEDHREEMLEFVFAVQDLIEKFNASNPNGWKLGIQNESIWFMEFPNKIIYDIIETHASKIANEITEICKKVKGVESILYVGGYCSNDILISSLKSKIPPNIISYILSK